MRLIILSASRANLDMSTMLSCHMKYRMLCAPSGCHPCETDSACHPSASAELHTQHKVHFISKASSTQSAGKERRPVRKERDRTESFMSRRSSRDVLPVAAHEYPVHWAVQWTVSLAPNAGPQICVAQFRCRRWLVRGASDASTDRCFCNIQDLTQDDRSLPSCPPLRPGMNADSAERPESYSPSARHI